MPDLIGEFSAVEKEGGSMNLQDVLEALNLVLNGIRIGLGLKRK